MATVPRLTREDGEGISLDADLPASRLLTGAIGSVHSIAGTPEVQVMAWVRAVYAKNHLFGTNISHAHQRRSAAVEAEHPSHARDPQRFTSAPQRVHVLQRRQGRDRMPASDRGSPPARAASRARGAQRC